MRINDAITGALLLAFGLAVIAMSWQFPEIPGQPYGAATFPLLIGIGFVLVSLVLMANGVGAWRSRAGTATPATGHSRAALFRMLLTVGLVVLYIAFSERLGFTLSSFLVLVTLFLALRVAAWIAVPVAILATLVIQQSFGVLMRVPLPRSEFFSFLW